MQHVEAQAQAEKLAEAMNRLGPPGLRVSQSNRERQYWLFVSLGIERLPDATERDLTEDIPFFEPPEWLRPFLVDRAVKLAQDNDDCPF